MEQLTFAELEHDAKKRKTRRELFLEKMDGLIPWARLQARIAPFYPKAGRGQRPYPVGKMLRVHCVRLFYNPGDPGMEDLLYDAESGLVQTFLRLPSKIENAGMLRDLELVSENHRPESECLSHP